MEQEEKVGQEEKTGQEGKNPAKNEKVKWIVTLGLIAVVAIAIFLFANGGSDKGKDPYELFAWGTKQETVFRKLDKLNIDYKYNSDDNSVTFTYNGVQGCDRSGDATLKFGNSGVLKSVDVTVTFYNPYSIFEPDAEDMAVQYTIIELTLKDKYGEPIESDYGTKWKDGKWTILLGEPYKLKANGRIICTLSYYKNE